MKKHLEVWLDYMALELFVISEIEFASFLPEKVNSRPRSMAGMPKRQHVLLKIEAIPDVGALKPR